MTVFIAVSLTWIIINLVVASLIRRNDETRFLQNMRIAMLWVAPFIGVLFSLGATTRRKAVDLAAQPILPGTIIDEAPLQLMLAGAGQLNVQEHTYISGEFPVLDWSAIQAWADKGPQGLGYQLGKKAWLMHLRDALGASYRLYESSDAFILSPLENNVVLATAEFITTTRGRIEKVLGDLASFPAADKSVLVVMPDEDAYYSYTSGYQRDGGHVAGSSGMFIHAGCPHFVVPAADLHQIEPVIAHELTHSALAHHCLPRWLDEGLAVNTEIRLTGFGINGTPQKELRERHLAFWGAKEIQEFWSGASFFRPDDGNQLSYELARILVAYLGKQWDSFSSFAKASQRSDGGAAAAQAALGVSLGVLACGLLEQEYSSRWEPALLDEPSAVVEGAHLTCN